MSKVDIRLLYQKHSGLGLITINKLIEDTNDEITVKCECPECGEDFSKMELTYTDPDLLEYVSWLEEELEAALSVGTLLFMKVVNPDEE